MKKILSLMLAAVMVLSVSVLFVSAAESAEVVVTISDEAGELAVAAEKVTVTDIDGDEKLTVNDDVIGDNTNSVKYHFVLRVV